MNEFERRMGGQPRLLVSIVVGALVALCLPGSLAAHVVARGLIGWNVGALLFLALAGVMMARASHDSMRQRALLQDMRPWMVLGMVIVAAVVSMVAVVLELALARGLSVWPKATHVGLAMLTIVTSWAFTQTMFALHYAHDFYAARSRKQPEGLVFPGTDQPDYFDFLYLSGVIGSAAQTADVTFTTSAMRRTGLVHCVFSFAFNTAVLALTINIAASLF